MLLSPFYGDRKFTKNYLINKVFNKLKQCLKRLYSFFKPLRYVLFSGAGNTMKPHGKSVFRVRLIKIPGRLIFRRIRSGIP